MIVVKCLVQNKFLYKISGDVPISYCNLFLVVEILFGIKFAVGGNHSGVDLN